MLLMQLKANECIESMIGMPTLEEGILMLIPIKPFIVIANKKVTIDNTKNITAKKTLFCNHFNCKLARKTRILLIIFINFHFNIESTSPQLYVEIMIVFCCIYRD